MLQVLHGMNFFTFKPFYDKKEPTWCPYSNKLNNMTTKTDTIRDQKH